MTSADRNISEFRRTLHVLLGRPTVVIGACVLVVMVAASIVVPLLSPYSVFQMSISDRLNPPALAHPLGTDDYGRDIMTRLAYAGRLSFSIGISVVCLSALMGVTLGVLAGFIPRLDQPISRLVDAMMTFPDILLAIALVAALGPSAFNVIIALSIVYAPRFARIVRASALVVSELTYIEAARALGVSTPRIILRHVLRNLVSPIVVQGTFLFATAMLTEAGLSFLGVGVSPSIPTWGTMIAQGRQYLDQAAWIMWFPGLAIAAAVFSLQLIGDGLRDLLDPRLGNPVRL